MKKEERGFYISSPYLEEPYPFLRRLYESGIKYLLCQNPTLEKTDKSSLRLNCPVRFLHRTNDDVVHISKVSMYAKTIQSRYNCKDVSVKLFINGGDHRLSRGKHIVVLLETLEEFRSKLRRSLSSLEKQLTRKVM